MEKIDFAFIKAHFDELGMSFIAFAIGYVLGVRYANFPRTDAAFVLAILGVLLMIPRLVRLFSK